MYIYWRENWKSKSKSTSTSINLRFSNEKKSNRESKRHYLVKKLLSNILIAWGIILIKVTYPVFYPILQFCIDIMLGI